MKRRSFFKVMNASFWTSQLFWARGASATVPAANSSDYDENLLNLTREQSRFPDHPAGYYSSVFGAVFVVQRMDETQAIVAVNSLDGAAREDVYFSVSKTGKGLSLRSFDGKYGFLWKSGFGLYALEKRSRRILELCPPYDGKTDYMPDAGVTVALGAYDSFQCRVLRGCYHDAGVTKSPLEGFEGFCEETLQMDASDSRDRIVGAGLDGYIDAIIPFGLIGLKTLAKVSPSSAALLLEKAFPKLIGWMLGPVRSLGHGRMVLDDCPYRKRLGTYPCEAICGHGIGKHYTEKIGIPVKFDPTAEGYKSCVITIGKA